MLPILIAILGVVLVVFGVRLMVDPAYRERYDRSRYEGIMGPLDRLWFWGPATAPLKHDVWKRVGWLVATIGAFNLAVVVVYLIAK